MQAKQRQSIAEAALASCKQEIELKETIEETIVEFEVARQAEAAARAKARASAAAGAGAGAGAGTGSHRAPRPFSANPVLSPTPLREVPEAEDARQPPMTASEYLAEVRSKCGHSKCGHSKCSHSKCGH